MGFNPATDLAGVSMAFATDHVLIVHPSCQAQTRRNSWRWSARSRAACPTGRAATAPRRIWCRSCSSSSPGLDMQHVPYRGSAPALNDTVAGNVPGHAGPASLRPADDPGRARARAGGDRPAPLRAAAELPTMAELGLAQAEATSWGAVMAPAGTPAPVVERLNAVIREALAEPAVQQRLAAAGADAVSSTPAELAATMRSETEKWGRVVREARITVN
jgi:tripartite-type tricarboxylate transporter receptor subunit TctC